MCRASAALPWIDEALYQRFITPVSRATSSSAPEISNTHASQSGMVLSFLCLELHARLVAIGELDAGANLSRICPTPGIGATCAFAFIMGIRGAGEEYPADRHLLQSSNTFCRKG
jgi:hypothetical protein